MLFDAYSQETQFAFFLQTPFPTKRKLIENRLKLFIIYWFMYVQILYSSQTVLLCVPIADIISLVRKGVNVHINQVNCTHGETLFYKH